MKFDFFEHFWDLYLIIILLCLNAILYIKYFIFLKKYSKNSLTLHKLLIVISSISQIFCPFLLVMFVTHNEPTVFMPVGVIIIIIIFILMSIGIMWISSRWRLTWYKNKFVYCGFCFSKKEIYFDEINSKRSYFVFQNCKKNPFELGGFLLFTLHNGKKIKVPYDMFLENNPDTCWIIKFNKFLTDELKLIKITRDEYNRYNKNSLNF